MKLSDDRMLLGFVLFASMFLMQACTTRLADFTVLSTKNVDVSGLKPGDRMEGDDCVNMLFGMFPLGQINWKTAMDEALEKGKGDVMVDVVLTQTGWAIPYIWGQQCTVIEGTISRTSSYKR